ncbi:MAG: hypothetical protein RQ885_06300 [Desulfurococcales archaeon]|jgi:hypothetical protein|nr:hypothetical protein [Desulfurococcales archaeon]
MPRTTVAVDDTIAKRISALARKFNLVLSSFSSEALSVAGDLLEMGLMPRDLKKLTTVMKIASFIDPIVLPMELFESLVKKASMCGEQCIKELDGEMESWGKRVASIIKGYYEDDIESLIDAVSKASKVFALREISVERFTQNSMEIKLVGVGKSELTTRLTYTFIKGLFEGLGYKVSLESMGIGIIKISVEKPM